ncbi:hypothetical protein SAMN06265379_101943 [Saccharicrinis carchari]|uniref:Uncharacterized protein n=1 Tax=Saccharicrinis carchari TaxID=1168039 RepID=A0A521BIV9_SACCC|nr:DUF4200 domain-containing protein [Saccharicrinis carchari]SMO46610.1 hypothetical protein SAMN06265379_101943 [Saccharicrinis carchari]
MRKLIILLIIGFVGVSALGQVRVPDDGQSPIYYKGSNVGIGNTNPNNNLEISDAYSFHSGGHKVIGLGYSISNGSMLNGYVGELRWDPINGKLSFANSTTSLTTGQATSMYGRFSIDKNGNVGIGTYHPNYKLDVVGSIKGKTMRVDFPNVINNWNDEWQCAFFDGYNIPNSPESNQWFWGVNMGHRSNNPDYRYGGQLVIRNSSTSPTMYFRSRDKNGDGFWAKVLHNKGNQRIEGNLIVNGQIHSEEMEVKDIAANNITYSTNGQTADFVFADNYKLRDLSEVETFIKDNKHLPDIPSAAEMEEQGVNLAEMNKLLLQKVEELTLYAIEKDKEVKQLKADRKKEKADRKQLEVEMQKMKDYFEDIKKLLLSQ